MKDLYDVVIVGGGPAGLTAALYLARAKYRVVVLEKEQFGGQVTITSEVVNYPGVFKTDGKGLTETMKEQAESFGAEFIMTEADRLEVDGDIKKVHTGAGVLSCFGILIATGANPRMVGFKGESEFKGHGVAYCATCDCEFFSGKDIFVIGGGYEIGLVKKDRYDRFLEKKKIVSEETERLRKKTVRPEDVKDFLESRGSTPLKSATSL